MNTIVADTINLLYSSVSPDPQDDIESIRSFCARLEYTIIRWIVAPERLVVFTCHLEGERVEASHKLSFGQVLTEVIR